MDRNEDIAMHELLNTLVNQPLRYGIKSPDTELFDFGFGEYVDVTDCNGVKRSICTYTLHALCGFEVIQRNGFQGVDWFDGNSSCDEFRSKVNKLITLEIKRIELSDKNDLWMDFGDFWVVFITTEDGEESWRFFSSNRELPHLVASDSWIRLEG